eukprot:TRINITY_DN31360_c0_g1_i1.p1 TRINITY_DN31360_c0_g1~~TRINITY_DN31360_c0_g1_i1.p1  ORF type:complete len:928 (-),score=158.91 TRINITY_DN31360_c0_g1_i1:123-2906(-)
MLRPKQVIPFCKGARSVLVSGVRNNSVDESAPCSEDDGSSSKSHLNSPKDCKSQGNHYLHLYRFHNKNDTSRSYKADNYQPSTYNATVEPSISSRRNVTVRQESESRPTVQTYIEQLPSCTNGIDKPFKGVLKTVSQIPVSTGTQETRHYKNSVKVEESSLNLNAYKEKAKSTYSSVGSYPRHSAGNVCADKSNNNNRVCNDSLETQRPSEKFGQSFSGPTLGTLPSKSDCYGTDRWGGASLPANGAKFVNSQGYYVINNVSTKPMTGQDTVFSSEYSGKTCNKHLHSQAPHVLQTSSSACLSERHGSSLQSIRKDLNTDVITTAYSNKVSKNDSSRMIGGNNRRGSTKINGVLKSKNHSTSAANMDLVEQASTILRQMHWGPATKEALNRLNAPLNVYQVNQILKLQQNPFVALNFFNWSKKQEGFKHDEHSYTTMIGILGNARRFDIIDSILDEMERNGCKPTVVTYNRLIHCYGRANYLTKALDVFHEMQAAGIKPDRTTYGTLINIHAKAGFLHVAMQMYSEMQEAGLSPDSFVYTVMINCLGKSGDLSAAYKLFCEMIERGCVPTLVTYNNMIDLHAKARKYPIALKLYRDMQNAGYQPDKYTYNVVMELHRHYGRYEEAEAVFDEMQKAGWVPDEVVYGLLVDMWGKVGHVQKAKQWFNKMLDSGIRPNVPTCNSLIGAFLRANLFNEAITVLQAMLQMNLSPSLQTYTLLISNCTSNGCQQDMCLFSALLANTRHIAHSFLLYLPSAEPDGNNIRMHAGSFFDLMHTEDRESKRGFADAIVNFLYSSDLKEEAGFVWEVAMERNLYPNAVTLKGPKHWSINLHVMSMGTALVALSRSLAWLRESMLMSGIEPNRIDIITGWGRRSRVVGSSLVKQSVEHILSILHSPFSLENGNSGCFVGLGRPLIEWMHASPLERMHLL